MIDLNYTWVDIHCPKCNYQDEIQLIDAKAEKLIFCNNCKSSIQLQNSNASVHTGIESINKAFKDLEDLFKNLSK